MTRTQLEEEIFYELGQLERLAAMAGRLSAVPPGERRPWDAAAAAKYVADVFAGLENLCKRRAIYLKLPWPEGRDSHTRVLDDFLAAPDLGGKLPAGMERRFKHYLGFRHRFIHGYGFEVSWEMAEEPLRLIPETVAMLKDVWQAWLASLPETRG